MRQPVQITKIENEKIGFVSSGFSQGLNTAVAESRIQLLFVHAKAGRESNQGCAQKTANQHGDQNLGSEFWQCGSRVNILSGQVPNDRGLGQTLLRTTSPGGDFKLG